MNKHNILAIAVSAALLSPMANAADAGDFLSVYGKLHMSVDAVDNGGTGNANTSNTSIASNSSRVGFKGKADLDGLNAVYQVEQQVNLDSGDGKAWATRNSYAGLQGGFGRVIVGYHDTPMKNVGRHFDLFGDAVGDSRSILSKMNTRAKNMLMYSNKFGAVGVNAMYSTAYENQTVAGQDDNDNDLTSLSLTFDQGMFSLAVATETANRFVAGDDTVTPVVPDTFVEDTGVRASARVKMGAAQVGVIWEDLDINGSDYTGYGANAAYKLGNTTLKAQYVVRDDVNDVANTGANQASVGADYKLNKQASVYAMYTAISNDDAATFSIGGGHGQKYAPAAAGEDVTALSLGLVVKF